MDNKINILQYMISEIYDDMKRTAVLKRHQSNVTLEKINI